jgi:cellulose synthase/poly-beta-1,6-N-acetylglucosamine synthase-like glycosyltransferase
LWLLQRGADVTATKEDGWNSTALHYAAAHGSIGVCEVLVAYDADVDAVDSFGFTPESLARKRRHAEVADYLASIKSKSATRPRPVELRGYDALLAPPVPEPWHNKFQNEKFNISVDLERGEKPPTGQDLLNVEEAAWKTAAARGEDGIGTEGTVPKEGLKVFRILAVCMQITNFGYLFYRAGWTFVPGATYGYSVFVFFMEYISFAFTFVFIFSMWNQIERPKRWISEMMPEEELPHVDIYIVRYNEPISLLEPTVVAALNINWPGDKLTVHILDDSQGKETMRMVKRLRFQLGVMKRKARLVSMTRRKLPGVPHHAKAGNITHAVLNSQGKGEFILVLDMDMIAHPDCLQRLLGHFYIKKEGKKGWERKPRTALIQTPQDFYNVPPGDPFVHSARFFYGPMMQGRDGIDSSPCCGTGAVFTRDSLVSVGGQSFGSITEDYNTSRTLFACGFTTMFLNERLSFGLAPEYIAEVFNQRQRWAMGALQMLFNPNSYGQYGLTYAQNLIFFDFLTYHFLAIPTVVMYIIPFIFIVFQIPPIQIANIWVFCVAFTTFFGKFQLSLSENELGGFRFLCSSVGRASGF